jgi:small subunit ribosomal protein S4
MSIFPPTKAQDRKPHLPGQHGPRLRRKTSEYGLGLNEKQKLRYLYGLTEKQFRRTFEHAKAQRGVTGEIFLQKLESRLDAVIYNLGFAKTRRMARQFVTHGHLKVNGKKCDIPSYQVKAGDTIEVRESTSSRQLATRSLEDTRVRNVPNWISRNEDTLTATVSRLPEAGEIETGINVQLIVEFYSR